MRGRAGFWVAVAAAVALFGGGLTIAYLGYAATSGPDGAVRGYYAALQRGDAPEALAFGTVPKGVHTLLTDSVLAEQRRIAPMRGFTVVSTVQHGDRGVVRVRYTLEFPGRPQRQQDDVRVRRTGGTWHLVRAALSTELHLPAALERATIVGAGIPEGMVLMFPGAVPIRFDSPYLELDPATASVSFASRSTTDVTARVSAAGHHAVARAIVALMTKCLSAGPRAAANCPEPRTRYVPGTLRGTLVGNTGRGLIVDLEATDTGRLDVTGNVRLRAHYRRLTFTNQPRTESGRLTLGIQAAGYAVQPLRLEFGAP